MAASIESPTSFSISASLLKEVQTWEMPGSRIINEWYDEQDYISRRHGHLGKHPDWKNYRKLLPKVYLEADEVWGSQAGELSCQEVRQRELRAGIEPLTPLPTDLNTDTIDSFGNYGEDEWKPPSDDEPEPTYIPAGIERTIQYEPPQLLPTADGLALPSSVLTEAELEDFGFGMGQPSSPSTASLQPAGTPVEAQQGKKRPTPDEEEEEEEDEDDVRPPSKRRRGLRELTPAVAPPAARASRAARSTRRKSTTPAPNFAKLEAIADGAALPDDPEEAQAATDLLRSRLLAQQRVATPRVRTLDHPPEWFVLPPPSRRSGSIVRCLCGAQRDTKRPGEQWIACDGPGCGVWQHVACVGDACDADPEVREEDGYLCHACDPWSHRELLAAVRSRGSQSGGKGRIVGKGGRPQGITKGKGKGRKK